MSLGRDELLAGWLHGRSLARGLPAPVRDGGGWRVDTGIPTERARLVYARALPEIAARAAGIRTKDTPIKALCPAHDLQALLGRRWSVATTGTFMTGPLDGAAEDEDDLPTGYAIEIERRGAAATARVRDRSQSLAASGHCAETLGVFVFDRIATHPDHRRKGLGRAVMAALTRLRDDAEATPALVATADGRALYRALGWRDVSPYVTARRAVTHRQMLGTLERVAGIEPA